MFSAFKFLFHNTLLKWLKKEYYGNEELRLAWDFKKHFFRHTKIIIRRVKKNCFFEENKKF